MVYGLYKSFWAQKQSRNYSIFVSVVTFWVDFENFDPLQLDCSSVAQWDKSVTFAAEVRF